MHCRHSQISRQIRARQHDVRTRALPDPEDQNSNAIDARARVRSEVLAPFRLVRLVLYGFFTVSATVGLVIALSQLAGRLADAPNALPLKGTVEGIGIDVGAIVVLLSLFRGDWQARQKQIARLTREERLASLQIELSNKKTLRLAQLRKFARPILVAGTKEQVDRAIESAEPFREDMIERGILLVPLPLFGEDAQSGVPTLTSADLKFKAIALRQNAWRSWFEEQMKLANATPEKGLYVSLRLDGRVRASGTGSPPWERFVAQLAPLSGAWKGVLDGMDGQIDTWG